MREALGEELSRHRKKQVQRPGVRDKFGHAGDRKNPAWLEQAVKW